MIAELGDLGKGEVLRRKDEGKQNEWKMREERGGGEARKG